MFRFCVCIFHVVQITICVEKSSFTSRIYFTRAEILTSRSFEMNLHSIGYLEYPALILSHSITSGGPQNML